MKRHPLSFLFAASCAFAMTGGCRPSPVPPATSLPSTQLPLQPSPTPTPLPIVVTNTADSGPGTLRQAIQDAQNGDIVTFDPAIFPPYAPVTIYVASGLPYVTQ